MPIKSIPQYMANPKPATVPIAAERLPKTPNNGLLLTQSDIIHVNVENMAIIKNVEPKYGTTLWVFFSNSISKVLEANLAVLIYSNIPESSALPTASRKASSHTAPLQETKMFSFFYKFFFCLTRYTIMVF